MSDQPHPTGVRLLPWRIPGWLVDAALIGMAATAFLGRPFRDGGGPFEASDWTDLAIAIGLLLLRRRFPVPTLVAGVGATVLFVAIVDRPTLLMPVTIVLLFTVALESERRVALIAGAATTVVFGTVVIVLLRNGEIDGAGLASIAWPGFATAAGTAVRTTRENIAAVEERARRAEESRELEASRRVTEERLRIARDVHDLVAHHIAVINVQSGVAVHLVRSDPAAASDALDVVRSAAATVVDELGELLSVLRTNDDDRGSEPTEPTPDLDAIDDLISSFAASGLDIRRETSGTPRALSESAQVAAYRVVQEALTNAHKYGDGSATVSTRFDESGLELTISNPTHHTTISGTGFGLIGMHERVDAVGGTLTAGAADRRFEVNATIPTKEH